MVGTLDLLIIVSSGVLEWENSGVVVPVDGVEGVGLIMEGSGVGELRCQPWLCGRRGKRGVTRGEVVECKVVGLALQAWWGVGVGYTSMVGRRTEESCEVEPSRLLWGG